MNKSEYNKIGDIVRNLQVLSLIAETQWDVFDQNMLWNTASYAQNLKIQSQRLLPCDWFWPLLSLATFLTPVVRGRKYLLYYPVGQYHRCHYHFAPTSEDLVSVHVCSRSNCYNWPDQWVGRGGNLAALATSSDWSKLSLRILYNRWHECIQPLMHQILSNHRLVLIYMNSQYVMYSGPSYGFYHRHIVGGKGVNSGVLHVKINSLTLSPFHSNRQCLGRRAEFFHGTFKFTY